MAGAPSPGRRADLLAGPGVCLPRRLWSAHGHGHAASSSSVTQGWLQEAPGPAHGPEVTVRAQPCPPSQGRPDAGVCRASATCKCQELTQGSHFPSHKCWWGCFHLIHVFF